MIETTPEIVDGMHGLSVSLGSSDPSDPTSIIGVLIPVIAIVMGIGIGMLSLYLDYRKKRSMYELHHKERMAAIEKGMDVPPLPPEFFENPRRRLRTRSDYLRRGLIWLLVGGAITAALYNQERSESLWGLVPTAVGLAYLLFYYLDGRQPQEVERKSP
jgi:Domain of unknown function (DUF6249)